MKVKLSIGKEPSTPFGKVSAVLLKFVEQKLVGLHMANMLVPSPMDDLK